MSEADRYREALERADERLAKCESKGWAKQVARARIGIRQALEGDEDGYFAIGPDPAYDDGTNQGELEGDEDG